MVRRERVVVGGADGQAAATWRAGGQGEGAGLRTGRPLAVHGGGGPGGARVGPANGKNAAPGGGAWQRGDLSIAVIRWGRAGHRQCRQHRPGLGRPAVAATAPVSKGAPGRGAAASV